MRQKELKALQKNAGAAAEMLKSLAHETRLLIVCFLASAPKNVQEIEGFLGTTQANVSQHLAKLRSSGVLSNQKEGNQVFYQVANKKVMGIVKILHEVYCK